MHRSIAAKRPFVLSCLGALLLLTPGIPGYLILKAQSYFPSISLALAGFTGWVAATLLLAVWLYGKAGRRYWRYLGLCALFGASLLPSNAPQDRIPFLGQLIVMAGAGCLFIGLIHWKASHPYLIAVDRQVQRIGQMPSRRWLAMLCAVFLSLAIAISWHCFAFTPGHTNSIAQYVHGKILAQGHWFASHPLQPFFHISWMVNTPDRWYSIWQPMHAFMMALGHLIHAPWLINPLEGTATLVILYHLALRIYGSAIARLTVLLALGSSFVLFMSSEFMNHSTSLLFVSLFLLSYVSMLQNLPKDPQAASRWALLAGLSLGCVALVRPLTALGISLPFAVYALRLLRQDVQKYLVAFGWMGIGLGCYLLFQLWYDMQTTGSPWIIPHARYCPQCLPGFTPSYTLLNGLVKTQREWFSMNRSLFEWILPSVLFAAAACLSPLKNRYASLLIWMVVSHTAVNMTNHLTFFVFGPRFLYEVTPALLLLTALGLHRLPAYCRLWKWTSLPSPVMRGMTAVIVAALFAGGWVYRLPNELDRYSHHFFFNNTPFYRSLLRQSEKPALIFIGPFPNKDPVNDLRYMWVAATNPPSDDAPVIFARDLDEWNGFLIDYYPGRHYYLERDGTLYPIDPATLQNDAPPQL